MGRIEYWNDPAAPQPNSLVPACGILAVDDLNRVLLQRRRDTGQWAIPMGKQEFGETPTQCAIRETLEETGVLTEITGLLGIYSDPGHIVAYTDGEIRQEWELILLGRPVIGTPTANDEASDVRWVAPTGLESLDIHPTQWRQLRDWLDGSSPHVD
ncbi:MAG: NUDIX domain-containing protein [Acidobacteriota bacterium]|nr:NUDIX domain-containing protein [Acidobacteriota bacterium]